MKMKRERIWGMGEERICKIKDLKKSDKLRNQRFYKPL